MTTVELAGFTCNIRFAQYANSRTAILLEDAEDGGPVATASINFPDEPMVEDEVAIKDYSENAGMLDVLVKAGVVATPHRYINSGFVAVPVCALMVNPREMEKS